MRSSHAFALMPRAIAIESRKSASASWESPSLSRNSPRRRNVSERYRSSSGFTWSAYSIDSSESTTAPSRSSAAARKAVKCVMQLPALTYFEQSGRSSANQSDTLAGATQLRSRRTEKPSSHCCFVRKLMFL